MDSYTNEIFKAQLIALKSKLDDISKLPYVNYVGDHFTGITFGDDYICYNTETWRPGCDQNTYYFQIHWRDIDNSLEWFAELFKREHEYRVQAKKADNERKQQAAEQEREKAERIKLKELQDKYSVI